MKRLAALLFLIAGAAKADPLYLPVSADFEVRAYQYAIESSAWNTPTIRLYPYQGSSPIDPSTYSWVYRFGESEYTTSMVTIAGSTGSNYVDFAITGADFSQPCYRWYSAFRAISGTTVVTFARGYLTIANSPEVTAASYIIRTAPTGTTTWVESIVSTDGSVVNRGDSVDQDLSVSNYVAQKIANGSSNHYTKAQSDSLYAPTGRVEQVATQSYTKAQSDARFATTDRVEQVAALVGGGTTNAYSKAESDAKYVTTGGLAVLNLRVDTATNNLAIVMGWGNHATNKYAVQGGNITGRWFALDNTQSGEKSFMGGGQGNSSISDYSAAVGGQDNISSGNYSFSGGGALNEASGNYSVVPGGRQVRALNEGAFAAGGADNEVNGDYGTVVGGAFNTATQQAFAAGIAADATNYGSFVFATPPPDGSGVTHFGSRGNSSFNLRAYGGVYFLAPNLWIQDTNGSTIAYFSPTGSVVRGPFQIGTNSIHYDEQGNMVATDVWIHVSRATNDLDPVRYDQFSVATSALAAAQASLATAQSTIAILTQQVASLITQLPIVSNAFVAADAVVTGMVAGVDTRLILTSNHFATAKTAQDNTNVWLFAQVTNRDHIVTTSLQASVAANLSTFSSFTNAYAAAITNVDAVAFGGTIKSGFMLASAWEDIRTNVLFGFLDTVAATNSAGAQNYMKYSSTNTWLHDGTSWRWWSRYGF